LKAAATGTPPAPRDFRLPRQPDPPRNRALHLYTNLRFYTPTTRGPLYGKTTRSETNVVSRGQPGPVRRRGLVVELPIGELASPQTALPECHELLSDRSVRVRGPRGYVELHPEVDLAQIFVLHG